MRRPSRAELDAEQMEILQADEDVETLLVMGPPGSGKTILALARADAIRDQNARVTLVVFNKVLDAYIEDKSAATLIKWLRRWWEKAVGHSFPLLPSGKAYDLDYAEAIEQIESSESLRKRVSGMGHWGHLIIDEAQDFPPEAHQLLRTIQRGCFPKGARPGLMVLADENQRLGKTTSSIPEIQESYMVSDDDLYALGRNYRNTKQIAQFAGEFYVGAKSGQPELPERDGERPLVRIDPGFTTEAQVDRICNWVANNQHEDVAVLVQYEKTRKAIFQRLHDRREQYGVRLQTYTSNPRALKELGLKQPDDLSKGLQFDRGGSVTVICFASAKGLEFDTVFLPELQKMKASSDDPLLWGRMQLYVMCSRARRNLSLFATSRQGGLIDDLLPESQEGLFRTDEDDDSLTLDFSARVGREVKDKITERILSVLSEAFENDDLGEDDFDVEKAISEIEALAEKKFQPDSAESPDLKKFLEVASDVARDYLEGSRRPAPEPARGVAPQELLDRMRAIGQNREEAGRLKKLGQELRDTLLAQYPAKKTFIEEMYPEVWEKRLSQRAFFKTARKRYLARFEELIADLETGG